MDVAGERRTGFWERPVGRTLTKVFAKVRDRRAETLAEAVPWDVRRLRGRKYCLLVSYRQDGTPVPTPVWFAVDGDRVYAQSGVNAYKLRRISRDPNVLVAPCNSRGKPLGPPMAGQARILPDSAAEALLLAKYGRTRRIYLKMVDGPDMRAYVEVSPR